MNKFLEILDDSASALTFLATGVAGTGSASALRFFCGSASLSSDEDSDSSLDSDSPELDSSEPESSSD